MGIFWIIFLFLNHLNQNFKIKILWATLAAISLALFLSLSFVPSVKVWARETVVKMLWGTSPTPPKLPQGELVGHWRQDSLTNEWLRVCSKNTRVWIPVSLFIRCVILGNYFTSLCLWFFTDNVGVLIILNPQNYEINEMIYTNVNPMILLHITACSLGFRTSVWQLAVQPQLRAVSLVVPFLSFARRWEESHGHFPLLPVPLRVGTCAQHPLGRKTQTNL